MRVKPASLLTLIGLAIVGLLAAVAALAALMATSPAARAETLLGDRDQTITALKWSPPCCIVDARSQGPRLLRPLKEAVPWSAAMRIKPTGTVVVIADDDAAAMDVAHAIAARFKAKDVLAVKGGLDTWRDVVAVASESGMPATFVIPKNTCEQGSPLQILRSNKR